MATTISDEKYPCTKCGACCRRAHRVAQYIPYANRRQGGCDMLNKNNTCDIYVDRPLICNSEKLVGAENLQPLHGISRQEFFEKNAQICNEFIREDGMDKKYLVMLA